EWNPATPASSPPPRSSTKASPAGPTRAAPAPASASTSTSSTRTPSRSSRSSSSRPNLLAVTTGGETVRKRTRLESDERRRQILDAARALLATRPYNEVSMADLAEAAGVARGLLHHYFGSKRDLYLAIVRDTVRVPT